MGPGFGREFFFSDCLRKGPRFVGDNAFGLALFGIARVEAVADEAFGFAGDDRVLVLVGVRAHPGLQGEGAGEVEFGASWDCDAGFGFAAELERVAVFAADPFCAFDGPVVFSRGVVGHFAFALVEGVGGDGLFGGRRLDRACHVFFDLFARQGAVVDADLVDQAVEEAFGEVGIGADQKQAF